MASPVPHFDATALAGEFQTMTGGGDATKGLTFDFCASVVEGVVADPNFTGVNDDDVRRVLGMEASVDQATINAINQRIAEQTEGLRRVVEGKYQGADGAAGIVVALEGGKTTINAQPDYVASPKA